MLLACLCVLRLVYLCVCLYREGEGRDFVTGLSGEPVKKEVVLKYGLFVFFTWPVKSLLFK